MKHYILCAITIALLAVGTGCKSKQQAASSTLAPWLQEHTATLDERYSTITLYEYEGAPYYAVFVRGPEKSYDMNRTTIYDAEGNTFTVLGGLKKRTPQDERFFRSAVNKGVIWKSKVAQARDAAREDAETDATTGASR